MNGRTRPALFVALVMAATSLPGWAPLARAADDVAAHGAGHVRVEGRLRTFAFSANLLHDGAVMGEAQLNARQTGVRVHVRIDCLDVDGRTAHMSGVVTQSNVQSLIGVVGVFSVMDRGEGPGDPPDLISLAEPTEADCRTHKLTPDLVVQHGNVQVR